MNFDTVAPYENLNSYIIGTRSTYAPVTFQTRFEPLQKTRE
jgi:hypothetical protein